MASHHRSFNNPPLSLFSHSMGRKDNMHEHNIYLHLNFKKIIIYLGFDFLHRYK